MMETASKLAQRAVQEGDGALKVIVVDDGSVAATVFKLLTKAQRVPKNQITQLGYSASDERNDQLLAQTRPFVIVPKDIVNNRPCVFRLPEGVRRVAAIQFLDGDVFSLSVHCDGDEHRFPLGWFS